MFLSAIMSIPLPISTYARSHRHQLSKTAVSGVPATMAHAKEVYTADTLADGTAIVFGESYTDANYRLFEFDEETLKEVLKDDARSVARDASAP
jgi:hypothetical protein